MVTDSNDSGVSGRTLSSGRMSSGRSARITGTASRTSSTEAAMMTDTKELIGRRDEIEFLLIAAERDLINDLYRRGRLKDEARRRNRART